MADSILIATFVSICHLHIHQCTGCNIGSIIYFTECPPAYSFPKTILVSNREIHFLVKKGGYWNTGNTNSLVNRIPMT